MTAPDFSPEHVMRTTECPQCASLKYHWCARFSPLANHGYEEVEGLIHPLRLEAAFHAQQPQEGAEPSAEEMDNAIEKWGKL